MDNTEVARVLYEIADYLELQGVSFKPQAYRKAAANIEQLEGDITDYHKTNRLREIPGIGEAIAEKIGELIVTGKLGYLEKLRAEIPSGIISLLEIPEVGPKTAMVLFRQLKIESVDQLKQAIFDHKLQGIKGFGPKTEEKLLQGIRILESRGGRSLLAAAYNAAEEIIEYLRQKNPNARLSVAGSLRRMKETIGDIDILAASDAPMKIMDSFVTIPSAEEVLEKGETKSSIRLKTGMQVDLRVVSKASFGAALQYFTGSKEHNIELRKLAISKGMKISEYGLFDRDTNRSLGSEEEEDIYRVLGMQCPPPELREARGEIEAALKNKLPDIIEYDELKGDLHCHTEWSDASGTIEDLRAKARSMNYEYVTVSDHSQSLKIAQGLSEERLLEQINKIKNLRDKGDGPWIFASSEVDVLGNGKLDYPKKIIEQLDYAIMSVHSKFKMDEKEMTERIITAMSNDNVKIFAHPTGRLIGQRASYSFDFDKVIEAAKQNGIAFEINSFPERLDLNEINVKRVIGEGIKIAIDSDAHDPEQLGYTRFGIATARRGWATQADIVNSMTLEKLKKEWDIS